MNILDVYEYSLRVLLIRKDSKLLDHEHITFGGLRVLLIRKDSKPIDSYTSSSSRLRVLLIRKDSKQVPPEVDDNYV